MLKDSLMTDDFYLWLSRIQGLSAKKANMLLNVFTPEELWRADFLALMQIEGLSEQVIANMLELRDSSLISAYKDMLDKHDISYVTFNSLDYPTLLKTIHDPPMCLYYKGTLPKNTYCVGVVGSRRSSEYGQTQARRFAHDLAERGITIVSGLAKGIDSFAHRGAIEAGGLTIAVLGSGVDICYPAENRQLYCNIIKNGCVLSEFPPGTQPVAMNFPIRNRVISGLSEAIVVVEAALRSGTSITVNMALEQGREVLAVPGNVTSKLSSGTNDIIRKGSGALAFDYTDVLNAIGIEDSPPPKKTKISLSTDEKKIFDKLTREPIGVEEIACNAAMSVIETINICTILEIKGYIIKMPGQRFAVK